MNNQATEGEKWCVSRQLGHALARARKNLGMSQAAVGCRLGLGQGTVSKMEAGRASIDVALLCRWAAILEVEPWVLLAEAAGTKEQAAVVRSVAEMAREEPRAWTTMKLLLTRPVRDTVE